MDQQKMTQQDCMEKYDFLLRLLEDLQKEQAYLMRALENLEKMPTLDMPGDIAGQARAMAVGDFVKSREATNQQLLKIYSSMYEDLRRVLFPKSMAAEEGKSLCKL